MKTYEVSLEQGRFNGSITIESAIFEDLKKARKIFDVMKKTINKNQVLYLMQYENNDTTLADVIEFKEGE